MAGPYFPLVGSGQSVSGAFMLEQTKFPLVIEVPSLNAGTEVRPQFSATSGGPFWTLQRFDGSGLPFAVHSGVGPAIGILERVPGPWGRLFLTSSVTAPATFQLYTGR